MPAEDGAPAGPSGAGTPRTPTAGARRATVDAFDERRRPHRWRRRVPVLAGAAVVVGLVLSAVWLLGEPVRPHRTSTPPSPPQPTALPRGSSAPTSPSTPPSIGPGPWVLAFDDEFSSTGLDRAKWKTCYDWGCTNTGNPESEWYVPQAVTVGGGVAELTARAEPAGGKPYSSGLLQTNGLFSFRYGYVEARVRLPAGKGLWPALWMLPTNYAFPPEIDVFELWGAQPDAVMLGVHHGANLHTRTVITGEDFTGWHTFALNWAPGRLTWYVDGIERFAAAVSVTTPMYLIANLAVLGSPATNRATTFPATMAIDYLRVWERR